jgi:hypothetical protein
LNPSTWIVIGGLLACCALVMLGGMVYIRNKKIEQLTTGLEKLRRALDEMDEQAKLIVRTDMELNKIQEELDKKVTGLYALQRLTRAISTSLEENLVFKMIEPGHLEDLGFEKACGFLWSEREHRFVMYLNLGYSEEEAKNIKYTVDPRGKNHILHHRLCR